MAGQKTKQSADRRGRSGLTHLRTYSPITRRSFGIAAAAAIGMTFTYPVRRAFADETKINYMGWQGYDDATNLNGFMTKNNLVLQPTYMESQEQWMTAMQSGGRGNMDLGTPVDFYVPDVGPGGLLAPLDLSLIPNMQRVFPVLRNMDNLNVGGKTYAVPFTFGALCMMYNAKVIPEAPTSWWELFNPKYKKKAAVVEDTIGVFMIFCMMATGTRTPWRVTEEMKKKTVDLMIKFKKEQALTICASYGDLGALLGNGEVVIAQGWEPVSTFTGKNPPPIKWCYPKEGTTNFVDTFAIFADAPHMELDHKILNNVMSADAQAACAAKNTTAVTNMDAVPLLSEKMRSLYPYDNIESYFQKCGGHYKMFPRKNAGEYLTYDQILQGWEEFLKA
jgi:spermidine/putrescine-binding protein